MANVRSPNSARRSRAMTSISAVIPAACVLYSTSFRKPAFDTLDPRSRNTAMKVAELTESVPGKPMCSLLLP